MKHKADRSVSELGDLLAKLDRAITLGVSERTCHQHWSVFIRARDGYRCVLCNDDKRLAAHHICRKSFLREARFMTGNGISLCQSCHKRVHEGFNGRADLSLPMDYQNGEKIETLAFLYSQLAHTARLRPQHPANFYGISQQVLAKFKMFQGYQWDDPFVGSAIDQAASIWTAPTFNVMQAIITANTGLPSNHVKKIILSRYNVE